MPPITKLKALKGNIVLFLFVVLTASGCCVVGPETVSPQAPILQKQFHGSQWASPDSSLSSAAWWSYFSDDILNGLIQQTQTQNLSLRESYERIVEARSNLLLQGGQLLPNGDLIGEYAYSKNSANARPFVAANSDPFDLFRLGFQSGWELDLFGKIRRSIEAADAELKLQEHEYEYLKQTLMSDVAQSYLRIRLLQNQIMLVEKNLGVQGETISLVRQREEAGVSTELDAQQTEAFRFRTQAVMSSLQQQVELEFNQLAILLGQVPNAKLKTDVGVRPLPSIPVMPQFGVPASLLMLRPDVKREEMAVRAATARIGVAQADLYPQISLLGSISVSAKSVSALFETNGLAFSVGPSFRWNVLHFNRINHNIDIQESRLRQALLRYQSTVLTAVREVEDSLISQEGFQRQWTDLNQAVAADERAVGLSLQRYKAGKANFQRVLDAQQQLLNDQQALVLAQTNAITETVRLFRAAGGWSFARQGQNSCSGNCNQSSCGCGSMAAQQTTITTPYTTITNQVFEGDAQVERLDTLLESHWNGQPQVIQPTVAQPIMNQTAFAPPMMNQVGQPVVSQTIQANPVSMLNVSTQSVPGGYPLHISNPIQNPFNQPRVQNSFESLPPVTVEPNLGHVQSQPDESWHYGEATNDPPAPTTVLQIAPPETEIEPFSIDFESLEAIQ